MGYAVSHMALPLSWTARFEGRTNLHGWQKSSQLLRRVLATGAAVCLWGCGDDLYFHLLEPRSSGTGGQGVGGTDGGGAAGAGAGGGSGGTPDGLGGAPSGGSASVLLHRYDFAGTGTTLTDRAGNADGEVRGGAQLDSSGLLLLDGVDDYVDLPPGLVSALDAMTVAVWLSWRGQPEQCWQRVFDFGNNDATEPDAAGAVTSSLFVTPSTCPNYALSAVLDFSDGGQSVLAPDALPIDQPTFVALVFEDAQRFELYLDGSLVAGEGVVPSRRLAEIDDHNNWLGRSQWVQDQVVFLKATYDEFRIYGRALTPEELVGLADRGPDTLE